MRRSNLFSLSALSCYFVSMMIGSLHAQVVPTLSVYVVAQFNATPFFVGLFFVAVAASAVVASQWVGVLSDRGANRRALISLGMIAGAAACLCFALSPSYWAALVVAMLVFSFSFITLPQVMALSREFADMAFPPERVALFNAAVRASFALSWVASPPLGFHLQHELGPQTHYLWLVGFYVLAGIVAYVALPRMGEVDKKTESEKDENNQKSADIPLNLKIGFAACAILFGLNHSYMIALPHLLSQHLSVETYHAGRLMGLAAAIEIPLMLLGGWLASRIPVLLLLRISSVAAIILFAGIWLSEGLIPLYALQFFNAVFIGFLAALGMTWFQDQMPRHPGVASSLFGNTMNVGNIIGSLLVGIFAAWLGYRHLYAVNAIAGLLAMVLLFFCR